ncbi:Uu.00g005330.m01.CDS01 [Anthostomella pinea]|uniref:Uu.00g005330.m01.CDS01 n=1 Tax=Anthostomella pinea TaxID=933095 RepID=A0AAI8VK74_9PEZI|nr:Uu.00g005330.m01.CDS01 [Anthostomella pinea]
MTPHRHSLQKLILSLFTLFPWIVIAFPETSDNRCDCYLTNASSSNYFTTHKFFDFRSLSQYADVPGPIADPYDSSQALATSDYFLSDDWTEYWGVQSWNNSDSVDAGTAPILMVNSPNNIYIENNTDASPASDTFMTMRTLRLEDYQSASEFESISQAYHYASVRMYARTIGAPGAVTAMFTYKDSGDPTQLTHVQESDLEIRTMDPPNVVQYTNQPSYTSQGSDIPASTRNVSNPGHLDWTEWAVYRMDWNPSSTTWYVDGESVASIEFQTPRDPSMVIFNAWSDGGVWSGNMSVGNEAYLQVQWIELVYNSTGSAKTTDKRGEGESLERIERRAEASCVNVCSMDDTTKIGTPVLLQGGASGVLGYVRLFGTVGFWIPLLSMALLFW